MTLDNGSFLLQTVFANDLDLINRNFRLFICAFDQVEPYAQLGAPVGVGAVVRAGITEIAEKVVIVFPVVVSQPCRNHQWGKWLPHILDIPDNEKSDNRINNDLLSSRGPGDWCYPCPSAMPVIYWVLIKIPV
ncbi:MAG: hypothetical protein U9P10_02320 [Thermodesulfobacteriota bacterium]|nr:hypothetical protein [Thermodesulfobacteriota bacterium]